MQFAAGSKAGGKVLKQESCTVKLYIAASWLEQTSEGARTSIARKMQEMKEQMVTFLGAVTVIANMGELLKHCLPAEEFEDFSVAFRKILKVRVELQRQLDAWESSVNQPRPEGYLPSRSQRRRQRYHRIRQILLSRDAGACQ